MKTIKHEFIHNRDTFFLIVVSFFFALLRVPSLIEPYWYGDEGIYEVIGLALSRGRILYKEIWDNKPPLLYVIYGLFSGDQFLVRLFSLLFGIGAVVTFFFLVKKLFESKRSQYISTLLFAVLFGLPVLEGNIGNAENFMLFPSLLAFYCILDRKEKRFKLFSIAAGLLLSFAFLTKIVAIFDLAALIVIIIVLSYFDTSLLKKRGSIVKRLNITKIMLLVKDESLFLVSFLLPIVLTILYFVAVGAFSDFFRAAFSQNVGYVGYGNYFLFPQGLLVLKLLLLSVSLLLVIKFRKRVGIAACVTYIWLAFSLFNAFFSSRPYTHYVLVLVPSVSLLAGLCMESFFNSSKPLRNKVTILNGVLFVAVLFIVSHSFSIYSKNFSYYVNYYQFVFGRKSVSEYQSFFDRRTPRDYEIARFISMNTTAKDSVFLWSDSGQIYALSNKLPVGRYIVAYHITFYSSDKSGKVPDATKETLNALNKYKPKYIIDTKHSSELNQFLKNYTLRYKISDSRVYERL